MDTMMQRSKIFSNVRAHVPAKLPAASAFAGACEGGRDQMWTTGTARQRVTYALTLSITAVMIDKAYPADICSGCSGRNVSPHDLHEQGRIIQWAARVFEIERIA